MAGREGDELIGRRRIGERKTLEDFIGLRYSLIVFSTVELIILSSVLSIVFMVYAGATPKVVGCGDEIFPSDWNQTEACSRLNDLRANSTDACVPVLNRAFESINIEFEYLCDKNYIVKTSNTAQMATILIGAGVFGQMSDWYGRRKVMLFALFSMAFFNVIAGSASNFQVFFFTRAFACFFAGGTSSVQNVFTLEHSRKAHRMLITNTVTWSPNFMIAPIIAYFAADWRNLCYYSAAINFAAFIALLFCSESPRFLMQQGRIEEAKHVIARIRKIDGDDCMVKEREIDVLLEEERERYLSTSIDQKTSYLNLFSNGELFIRTLIIAFGIGVTAVSSYSLIFKMENISGNLYVNGVIFGALRWVMNIVFGFADLKYPSCTRKRVATICKTINLCCLINIIVLFALGKTDEYPQVLRLSVLTLLVFAGPIFVTLFLVASEIYPTSVRNVGASFQSMCSRLGTIFATTIFLLEDFTPALPYWVLAILLFFDILLFAAFIPETKGCELKDHITKRNCEVESDL